MSQPVESKRPKPASPFTPAFENVLNAIRNLEVRRPDGPADNTWIASFVSSVPDALHDHETPAIEDLDDEDNLPDLMDIDSNANTSEVQEVEEHQDGFVVSDTAGATEEDQGRSVEVKEASPTPSSPASSFVEASSAGGRTDDQDSKYVNIHGLSYLARTYFGREWDTNIWELQNVPPIETPPNMVVTPHAWQSKGAAQAHFACRSFRRGIIIGDEMGLGKTLLAILAMKLAQDEHGCFSLVVCPKAVEQQWVEEIRNAFEAGHEPRVFVLEDSSITAHQLLGAAYDVIIVSYEYMESSYRSMRDLPKHYKNYARGRDLRTTQSPPERVASALHADFWRLLNLPIKRVVFDECHRIKNHIGKRFEAAKALFFHSCILLSGTFMDNKWTDVTALFLLLKGHPFTTAALFRKTFAEWDARGNPTDPEELKIHMLQKCLMAFAIARPSRLLSLPRCQKVILEFDLLEEDKAQVELHMIKYDSAMRQMMRNKGGRRLEDISSHENPLGHAIRAMQSSLHRQLIRPKARSSEQFDLDKRLEEIAGEGRPHLEVEDEDKENVNVEGLDSASNKVGNIVLRLDAAERLPQIALPVDNGNQAENVEVDIHSGKEKLEAQVAQIAKEIEPETIIRMSNSHVEDESRAQWLKFIEENDQVFQSARVQHICTLYENMRRMYPTEKVVIFSAYLKFLDVVSLALRKRFQIEALRFDGTVNKMEREGVQTNFNRCDPNIPLLVTAAAGGVGLNITAASIVIQSEIWWNHNVELQAYARCYRQGQTHEVKIIRLEAKNSAIDSLIKDSQQRKTKMNRALMTPLVRGHDEPLIIPKLVQPRTVSKIHFPELEVSERTETVEVAISS